MKMQQHTPRTDVRGWLPSWVAAVVRGGKPVANVEQAGSRVAPARKSVGLLLQRAGERIVVPVRIG